jgi:hypothetical protein
MRVVVSQSMYFPWVGLFEQIGLADIFVHYDDVQFTRGFFNRVQIKTKDGIQWLTVPLRKHHRGQLIDSIEIDESIDWRGEHRESLRRAYARAPFCNEMLSIVDEVFGCRHSMLAEVARASMLRVARYFGIMEGKEFRSSSDMHIDGSSSQRLFDICRTLKAEVYVTGHGAKGYLDHPLFASSGIGVEYMNYEKRPYRQLHGEFSPFVSCLDLIANCGVAGRAVICSKSIPWETFINESA